jgi:hypothetical protein
MENTFSYGWFFTLTPFILRRLMVWSRTASPDNGMWNFLGYCEYAIIIFWILTIGFFIGEMVAKDKEKNYDKLKNDHFDEVRKTASQFKKELKAEYVPLKEEISKLEAKLDAMEWKARFFERELVQEKANARKTAEDANNEALASVAEV